MPETQIAERPVPHRRAVPVGVWLLLGLAVVGLLQVWLVLGPGQGRIRIDIALAGLTKPLPADQWWRLLTSPLLHGSLMHWLMNGLALFALATWMERLAPRWWSGLTWLAGALAGGLASLALTSGVSVGASGGIVAMMGFVGVLAWRWQIAGLKSGVLQGLGLTALIGVLLPEQIDNAAHGGGLLAGAVLGWLYAHRAESAARHGRPPAAPAMASGVVTSLVALQAGFTCWVLGRVLI